MPPVIHHHDHHVIADDTQVLKTFDSALEAFDSFYKSSDLNTVLHYFKQICDHIGITNNSTSIQNFYPKIKSNLQNWKTDAIWSQFDKKINKNAKIYKGGETCKDLRVLIIGAGPCGLRAAIEAQFLGAKVTVIEKREKFSRNNVLKLWPFIITDLKELGAKHFYRKLGTGGIEHISIRRLQVILLKIALLLGVQVFEEISYEDLLYPTDETTGWKAKFIPRDHIANQMEFDALICADGNKQSVKGFEGTFFRASLAIAITANFVNRHKNADVKAEEISGVSAIYRQDFFRKMKSDTGINLENIVYFKDDTHYFVMTAKKQSLLEKSVIIRDTPDSDRLLHSSNVNQNNLIEYAKEAAHYATKNQLPDLDFEKNHSGKEDVAIFDFTNIWQAKNACRMVERMGHKLLISLVGDSLLESFWPTGSGCARGFFSAFDTCWMLKQWKVGKMLKPLEVMAERESLYKVLSQMTVDNIMKNFANYSLDPASRYTNTNKGAVLVTEVWTLLDTDDLDNFEISPQGSFNVPRSLRMTAKRGDSYSFAINSIKRDSLPRPGSLWQKNKIEKLDTIVPKKVLLTWCKNQVASHQDITVNNITSSFKDGRVLCAIIHRYRPDLIDMNYINSENIAENNEKAFFILETEFGIKPEMTGKDLANSTEPNSLKVMSYISKVYKKLHGEKPAKVMPMVPVNNFCQLEKQSDKLDKGTPYKPTFIILHFIQLVVSLGAILMLLIYDYNGVLELTTDCQEAGQGNYNIKADIGYTLSLASISPAQELCYSNNAHRKLQGSYSLYCQIFVAVGGLSTITALIMLLKDLLIPKLECLRKACMLYLDVVVSVVFLVCWVVSSAVLVLTVLGYMPDTHFNVVKEAEEVKLWVAVGLGCFCVLLYLLNMIILLEEKRRLDNDTVTGKYLMTTIEKLERMV